MQFFLPGWPSDFVAIDILGSLTIIKQEYRFVVVTADRYNKVTRDFAPAKLTAKVVVATFLKHCVVSYEISNTFQTNSGVQSVSKFLAALCVLLRVRLVTTMEYCQQLNEQDESKKRPLVTCLSHYIDDHQTDWGPFVQSLIYGYSKQVCRDTRTFPYNLVLRRELLEALKT